LSVSGAGTGIHDAVTRAIEGRTRANQIRLPV